MAWTLKVSPTDSLVEATYSSVVSRTDLMECADAILKHFTAAQVTRVLADCSTMTAGPSVMDLYELAEQVAQHPAGRYVQEAVLLPAAPELREDVIFWETVGQNRGLRIKAFTDRQSALRWLLPSLQTAAAASVVK